MIKEQGDDKGKRGYILGNKIFLLQSLQIVRKKSNYIKSLFVSVMGFDWEYIVVVVGVVCLIYTTIVSYRTSWLYYILRSFTNCQ